MTELTNTMTKQELIATQNVNNMENGSLISRVEQNEQDISQIADYVVERGTSGMWIWEKYQSGIVKCWGNTTLNYSNVGAVKDISLPFAFSEIPVAVFLTLFDDMGWRIDKVYNNRNLTTTSKICPIGFTTKAEYNGVYNTSIYVIGKWK